MAGMGERLWDIGRSPAQHMTVLVFGLLALLTGIVATSILAVAGGGGGATSIIMAALILGGIDGHSLSEHSEVGARAGQTLRHPAPRFAAVRCLPDGHLPLREDAVPRADQGRHERGVLLPRMRGNRKSEIGRQAFRDFRPRSTVRSAMVGPAVVLLKEGAVPGGVPGELVHALAPLRILVWEEFRPDAAVLGRPATPTIPRLERPDRTDPDDAMPRLARA